MGGGAVRPWFDINDVYLDYVVLDPGAPGETMGVLLVAAKKGKVDDYKNVVTQAGRTPGLVDVDVCALQNCYEVRMLPVTDRAIVRTKFRLMLAMGAVYWLAMEGIALARGDDGMVGPETLTYITLVSLAALLCAALCQIGIWRFEVQAATPAVLVYMAATMVFAISHTASLKHKANWPILTQFAGVRWLAESLWVSHIVLMTMVLPAYYGLMRIGVRFKTSSEAHL